MKFTYPILLMILALIAGLFIGCSETNTQTNPASEEDPSTEESSILIFTKTAGFRHTSIPDGINAIEEFASQNGVGTFQTENSAYFNVDSLAGFDAVIFLSTTGDILNNEQQQAFEQFIQNGGGFVGIHSATDTEYDWPWYGEMIGAYFKSHPQVQEATIKVLDDGHPSTSFLSDSWTRTDEWYNFRDINPGINVLLTLDESSYEGGKNGENHPIAWYHEFDGGRVFYTGGGHTSESYSESLFRQHLLGGIKYVLNQQ